MVCAGSVHAVAKLRTRTSAANLGCAMPREHLVPHLQNWQHSLSLEETTVLLVRHAAPLRSAANNMRGPYVGSRATKGDGSIFLHKLVDRR
jgi:hypothetical protein